MCSGDTALEKARVENGSVVDDVDGWGTQHECRDYETIFQWARDYKSMDGTGIG
jgi:hypothetical protein